MTGAPELSEERLLQDGEAMATTDAVELVRRWGDLASLPGREWPLKGGEDGIAASWKGVGGLMVLNVSRCHAPPCRLDRWYVRPNRWARQLEFLPFDRPYNWREKTLNVARVGKVQPDGSVVVTPGGGGTASETWRVDKALGTLVVTRAPADAAVYEGLAPEQAQARARAAETRWASVPRGSFGPFDLPEKRYFADEYRYTEVSREPDGSLVVRRQRIRDRELVDGWHLRATGKASGHYEATELGSAAQKQPRSARLLPNGELQIETDTAGKDGRRKGHVRLRISAFALTTTSETNLVDASGAVLARNAPSTGALQATTHDAIVRKRLEMEEIEANNRAARAERFGDRGRGDDPPPPRRSFAETFASTLQQEMRNKPAPAMLQPSYRSAPVAPSRLADGAAPARQPARPSAPGPLGAGAAEVAAPARPSSSVTSGGTMTGGTTAGESARNVPGSDRTAAVRDAARDGRGVAPGASRDMPPARPLPAQAAARSTGGSTAAEDYWTARRHGSGADAEKPAAASLGPARAWCMQKRNGEFWCNGPFQSGAWGKTLARALEMAGCAGGSGYTPTPGTGGQSFNCGRDLKPSEQAMPTYDPFARQKD